MPTATRRTAKDLLGIRAVPKNARDRLIDTAINLFYDHGFHVIGLDRILAETGVTKTTFYKHFDSKDDLIVAAIERRDEWETTARNRAIKKLAGKDPVKQMLALFDVLDLWFNDPEFKGCIFITAAVEFPDPRDPAHQAAAAYKKNARDYIRDLAKKAGAPDPETFADLYATIFEGTIILRHIHHNNHAAKTAKPLAEALIAQHIPTRSSSPVLPSVRDEAPKVNGSNRQVAVTAS
jgi:AcrR family transcriptional regulator